jgi:hypothetical protein
MNPHICKRGAAWAFALVISILALPSCGSDDDDSSGSAGRIACDYAESSVVGHYCVDAPGSSGNNGCTQGGGKELASCPSGCVATCTYKIGEYEYHSFFYGAQTSPAIVAAACLGSMIDAESSACK